MSDAVSRELVAARVRVERWRRDGGGRGSRIPEDLWNEAAAVARAAGVWATARALHLNYERLKARVSHLDGEGQVAARGGAAFVELGLGQVCGGRTVLELVGRGGERMRIEVTGTSTVDVIGLSQSFWSRQS